MTTKTILESSDILVIDDLFLRLKKAGRNVERKIVGTERVADRFHTVTVRTHYQVVEHL